MKNMIRYVAALGSFIAVLMVAGCADTTVAGMTPTQTFSKPQTAQLVEAVMSGDYTGADKLLAQGVDVNAVGTEDLTPLLWVLSASHFDEKKLEYLLKAGANPNFQEKKHHASAMYFAVHNQKPRLLKLLLEHGGNPSLSGWGGGEDESILQIAALHGDEEILNILVDAGADINWLDKDGRSAANTLLASDRFDLIVYLLNHGLTAGLDRLARGCQGTSFPAEMQIWRDKVLVMLKERGAKFTWDKN
jgi:ankyrin repeat protein